MGNRCVWVLKNVRHNCYMNIFDIFNIECDRGSYGANCNETCGHCRYENPCFNVNGTCVNGCDAGYTGHLCKTREYTCTNCIC